MNDPLNYVLITLLALFGFAAVLYISVGLFMSRRRACPKCGARSLRCAQWIRATTVVNGVKTPVNRSYYQCDSCGAQLRAAADKSFSDTSEAEWRRFCSAKW